MPAHASAVLCVMHINFAWTGTEHIADNISNGHRRLILYNLLKNTQFRQSKEKPSLYVGFQVMSAFLEMRRLILLQKMASLSLLLPVLLRNEVTK